MVADFDNKPYQPALQNQSQVSSNYDETLADKCPKAPVTHGSVVIPIFEDTAPKVSKNAFPWKRGIWETVCRFLLSASFQSGLQLCLGSLLVQLFTYNNRLRFTQSCLATVFVVAGMILVAPDCHMGGRLVASALILGPVWAGALICCATISLARAPHIAYTTFLIVFLAFALVLLTSLRTKGNLGVGIVSNLAFGITLIAGQFSWPAKRLWQEVCIRVLKIGLLSSFGVLVSGLFVLPTSAGDDLRSTLAKAFKDLGLVVSEQAGHLLLRAEDEHLVERSIGKSKKECDERGALARNSLLGDLELVDGETDQENIERLSNPKIDLRPQWMTEKKTRRLADIRPELQRCRALFANACVEPNFLRIGVSGIDTHKWPPVMNALDSLVMRVAALDSLIEGDHPLMLDSEIIKSAGVSLLPAYRLLYAQIAAALASIGGAIQAEVDGKPSQDLMLMTPVWAVLEYDIAAAVYGGLKAFWAVMRRKAGSGQDFVLPPPELRAALYMGTIGSAILEAMVNVENAVEDALLSSPAHNHFKASGPVKEAIKVLSGSFNRLKPQPEDIPGVQNIIIDQELSLPVSAIQRQMKAKENGLHELPSLPSQFVSFRRSLGQRPLQSKLSQEKAEAQHSEALVSRKHNKLWHKHKDGKQSKHKMPVTKTFKTHLQWAVPLLKVLFAWDIALIFWELFATDIPSMFSSWKSFKDTVWRNRWFQFAVKFFTASFLVLAVLMALQEDRPWTRSWNGLYINMTVVVVLSEKVDTTVQKGILRILTTCLGAVVGWLIMLNSSLASSSYGLAAFVCLFSFIAGLLSLMPSLKYALFLFLITLDSVILCQYDGKHHGSTHNFYTRLIVTVWGVVLCLIFDLVMPWYASSAALETLGQSVKSAGEILAHFSEVWDEELEAAMKGEEEDLKDVKSGLNRIETDLLQKRLASPLGAVQGSIAREGVAWKQGTLAMPRIVGEVISLIQQVLEKLAALELMLAQKPIVSGRFSGTIWRVFAEPMLDIMAETRRDIVELCSACASVMGEFPTTGDLDRLEKAIQKMMASRAEFRRQQRRRLTAYVELVVEGSDPLIQGRTTDDGVRYQSVVFAFAKSFDKITTLARILAEDPWLNLRCKHPHSWRTWRTWLGRYGYS